MKREILFLLLSILGSSLSFIFGSSIAPKYNSNTINYEEFKVDCSCWDGKKIDTLIFKGGGSRAVVYIGAIKRLEESKYIDNIKNFAGTSSGAQTAALICCGYNSNVMKDIVVNFPWKKVTNTGLFNLKGIKNFFKNYGYYDSNNLMLHLEELLYNKTKIHNITFLQLYKLSNKHLKIGTCSISDRKFKYLDHITYPNMPVSVGLAASSSIPFVFSYTKWGNETFIDGGLVGNLPITAFPENKCLAFNLLGFNEVESKLEKNPKNIIDFLKIVFSILYKYAQEMISPKNRNMDNVEYIQVYADNIKLLDPKITRAVINHAINCGYKVVDNFLNCDEKDL